MIEVTIFLVLMSGILVTLILLVWRVEELTREMHNRIKQLDLTLREEIRQSVLLVNTWTRKEENET